MKIDTFELERTQSLWENIVDYNLTDTGVHPFNLNELLNAKEIKKLLSLRMGYGYTNGSEELRDSICRFYPGTDRDNILVTNGTAEANFLSMWSHLEKGDEVVIMLPNYMQNWGICRALGVETKPFQLKEDLQWGVDIDEIRCLVSRKTKMIILCNPNNPTGSVMSEEEMNQIVEMAREADSWIFADEIYRSAALDGSEQPSFWGKYDKVLVSSGMSKAFGLPGLRIGWIVGSKEIIADLWEYHDYTTIAAGILSNFISTIALKPENLNKILKRSREILNNNLAILMEWVNKYGETFKLIPPRAGGMAFIRYNLDMGSTELCTKLREKKSVFIVSGDCFGLDNFIRLGFGGEPDYLQRGLHLIDEFLYELNPK
jgi:aspartate/methionine/tyrosine aminotransferase